MAGELIVRVNRESRLPDNDQWTNRFQVKSESSNRLYIIAQNKQKRHFGCSCVGYKIHRNCKHLQALNLPSYEKPIEIRMAD